MKSINSNPKIENMYTTDYILPQIVIAESSVLVYLIYTYILTSFDISHSNNSFKI